MTNNQLKTLIMVGLFAVPFIPLIISSSLFFPYITGKAFAFRFIVEVVLAGYLVLALRDPAYRPRFSWVAGALLLFMVSIGLADLFAENPFKAFWSNYERMEGYVTILHLGAYFLVMSSVFKSQEVWNRFLATSLGASLVAAIYSFFQLAGKITINQGGVRVDGTFGNATYLGMYMVFHVFFAALLFTRFRQKWQRILLGAIAAIDLTILYYTATRGAIIGLLGGAVVTFLFLLFKSQSGDRIRKLAVAGLVTLTVFVGIFFLIRNQSFVRNNKVLGRFASLSFAEIKTQGRYYVWPMAVKGALEKPILGWGQEGFNFVFNKYYDPRMYDQEQWFDRAHNTYLDWLIAGGLLGLLSYLSIIVAVLYYVFKAEEGFLKKEDKALILGVLAAYLFNNLFVFDQITSYIFFFTILAYVHAHSSEATLSLWNKLANGLNHLLHREKWHPIFESTVLILLIIVVYIVNYRPWQQNKNLLAVLRIAGQNQIGEIADYRKPLSSYGMWFSESLEHVSQAAIGLLNVPAASTDLKQQVFTVVDSGFAKHLQKVPHDARYHFFYGVFLSRFGFYDRAITELKTASDLSPRKQQIYFELANNYLLANQPKEAEVTAKTAFDLAPSYLEARLIYGMAATAAGDALVANDLLSQVDESSIIFDDRYLNILFNSKQYEKMVSVVKKRIELRPDNVDNRLTLAGVYLQLGRRTEAVGVLEEIGRLNPALKEQADYFIKEIKAGRNP